MPSWRAEGAAEPAATMAGRHREGDLGLRGGALRPQFTEFRDLDPESRFDRFMGTVSEAAAAAYASHAVSAEGPSADTACEA
jgi:hypothetical protein